MKFIISLDLSTKCTGYAVFALDGSLVAKEQIKPKSKLNTHERIQFIASEIFQMLVRFKTKKNISVQRIVIEDIYLGNFSGFNQVKGFATLARLSGAVMILCAFAERKEIDEFIVLRSAVEARPLVGLKGTCKKAEVQLWVIKKFNVLAPEIADQRDKMIETYEGLIEALQAELEFTRHEISESDKSKDDKSKLRKSANAKYKREMEKISKLIERETGQGEDVCDAILLGYGQSIMEAENEKITTDNGITTVDISNDKKLPKTK